MGRPSQVLNVGTGWTRVVSAALVMLGSLTVAAPAWAHGVGETKQGYVLVQQALGHLAHDQSTQGVMLALEKIDDVLATSDQQGVDISVVKRAQSELMAGRVEAGRELLQESIAAAVASLGRATGEATGTTLIPIIMPGRGALTNRDWSLLWLSFLLTLAGAGLALRYRPQHSVRELGRQLRATTLDNGGSSKTWRHA